MSEWCVMASGPSMCQADADLVRDWRNDTRKAIAINNTYQLAPWADVIYGCDDRWWKRYHEDVFARCPGEKWAYQDGPCKKYGCHKARLRSTGGNSGYQSVRLAITEFKAKRIILLGFDLKSPGHWHPEHHGFPNPTESNIKQWRGHLRLMGLEFPEVEIINCTRETALDCFPRMPLEDALCAVSPF